MTVDDSSSKPTPKVGATLGRFTLQRKLGKGGMGVVYLALDTLLDVPVALKLLNPELASGEGFDRFRREVLLARRVTHPGVCRIFDIHEEQGWYFITMEYVEGPTLHEVIRETGLIAPELVVALGRAVAKALAAAHQHEVIHRDLKPANIVVRGQDRISVLDFGLSKGLGDRGLTQAGFQVGTLHFMAPEVLRSQGATRQSDVYSLGVVLYECATGRLPFQAANILDLQQAIVEGKAVPPQLYAPELPAKLAQTITRAMALRPEQRFHSMEQLDQALQIAQSELAASPELGGEFSSTLLAKLPSDRTSRVAAEAEFQAVTEPGDEGEDGAGERVPDAFLAGSSLPTIEVLRGAEPPVPAPVSALNQPVAPPSAAPAFPAAAPLSPVIVERSAVAVIPPPRRRGLLLSLAGVAALLLGGALLLILGRGGQPQHADGDPPVNATPDAAAAVGSRPGAEPTPGVVAKPSPDAGQVDATPQLVQKVDPTARPEQPRSPGGGVAGGQGLSARSRALKRELRGGMRKKGLIRGDLPELDRAMRELNQHLRGRRFPDALAAGKRGLDALEQVQIDRRFIERKLLRFNNRFDQVGAVEAEEDIRELSEQSWQALDRGDLQAANHSLNKAFALLGRPGR